MTPSIGCCYRDCDRVIWSPRGGRLTVMRSSATCLSCRRVALCLPHFESFFERQRHLRCPHCGGEQWLLSERDGQSASPTLTIAVETAGGRADREQVRPAANVSAPGSPAAATDVPTVSRPKRPPIDPGLLAGWRWMTRSALPPDVVVFDHGVLGRTQPRGTTLLVDGTPVGDPLPGRVDAVVRASPATLDVIVAETRGEVGRVAWLRPGGQQTAVMPGPASARLGTPTVVDARRFLFVRSHGSANALWEATVAVGDRFRLRRIRTLGDGDSSGIRLAIAHYRRAVVAARADGEAHGLQWISLADGRQAHLIDLDGPPRIVVAARHEAQAAWIATDGAVWVGGMQGSTRKIGSTTGSTLAISHDGRRVCWSEGDVITLADLDAGQTVGHEVDDHVAWLSVA